MAERYDPGQAAEMIRQGLRRAGPGRQRAMPSENAGGSGYFGHELTEAQQMIREGLRADRSADAVRPPRRHQRARAAQIGARLIADSEARLAEQRPREAPTEPARTAEDYIRAGLRAERARTEATARAKAEAAPKVRTSW